MSEIEKVPVRIVQTQDIHGTKKVSVMLDVGYYIKSVENPDEKIQQFKKLYFDTLKKGKKVIAKKGKRKKTSQIWELSKILTDFNRSIENEFFITNLTAALQRDFKLTDSYFGVIFQFARYFKKEEILDKIPFSNYFELTLKKRQLSKKKLWDKEKEEFLERGKNGTLPGHKEYRQELKKLLGKR